MHQHYLFPDKSLLNWLKQKHVLFQWLMSALFYVFRAFGEIKTLRLPKKLTTGSEQHRGFAFVDFHSKSDAKVYFMRPNVMSPL